MVEFLLARVTRQRDNGPNKPNVVGKWVAWGGFTDDVREAQVFLTEKALYGRCPLFWEFEVIRMRQAQPVGGRISKESLGEKWE